MHTFWLHTRSAMDCCASIVVVVALHSEDVFWRVRRAAMWEASPWWQASTFLPLLLYSIFSWHTTQKQAPGCLIFLHYEPYPSAMPSLMSILCFSWPKQFSSYGLPQHVPSQEFHHEGLIHAVSSEQLMLSCVFYLNSETFMWALICEAVNWWFLRLVTLGLLFLGWSWRTSFITVYNGCFTDDWSFDLVLCPDNCHLHFKTLLLKR